MQDKYFNLFSLEGDRCGFEFELYLNMNKLAFSLFNVSNFGMYLVEHIVPDHHLSRSLWVFSSSQFQSARLMLLFTNMTITTQCLSSSNASQCSAHLSPVARGGSPISYINNIPKYSPSKKVLSWLCQMCRLACYLTIHHYFNQRGHITHSDKHSATPPPLLFSWSIPDTALRLRIIQEIGNMSSLANNRVNGVPSSRHYQGWLN